MPEGKMQPQFKIPLISNGPHNS